MRIIDFDINNVPANDKDLVLCLGFYDGLHLGHQDLIKKALAIPKISQILNGKQIKKTIYVKNKIVNFIF